MLGKFFVSFFAAVYAIKRWNMRVWSRSAWIWVCITFEHRFNILRCGGERGQVQLLFFHCWGHGQCAPGLEGSLHTHLHGLLLHQVETLRAWLCSCGRVDWGSFLEKVCESCAFFLKGFLPRRFSSDGHRRCLGGDWRWLEICPRQLLPGDTTEKHRVS